MCGGEGVGRGGVWCALGQCRTWPSCRARGGSGTGLPGHGVGYGGAGRCGGWAGMLPCAQSGAGPAGEIQGRQGRGAGGHHWLLCPQDGAPGPSDSVPSLQSMALLLDRLAKENQDIRLLQAQLQVRTCGRAPPQPGAGLVSYPGAVFAHPHLSPLGPWRACSHSSRPSPGPGPGPRARCPRLAHADWWLWFAWRNARTCLGSKGGQRVIT